MHTVAGLCDDHRSSMYEMLGIGREEELLCRSLWLAHWLFLPWDESCDPPNGGHIYVPHDPPCAGTFNSYYYTFYMVGCIFIDHFCYCMVTVRQHWREAGKIHAHKRTNCVLCEEANYVAVKLCNMQTLARKTFGMITSIFLKKHAITFQKAIVAALIGLTVYSYIWFPIACWQAALMDCKWGHAGLSAQLYTWLLLDFGHKLFFFFLKHHKHCTVGFIVGQNFFCETTIHCITERFLWVKFFMESKFFAFAKCSYRLYQICSQHRLLPSGAVL